MSRHAHLSGLRGPSEIAQAWAYLHLKTPSTPQEMAAANMIEADCPQMAESDAHPLQKDYIWYAMMHQQGAHAESESWRQSELVTRQLLFAESLQ
jgi:hypothetical protein